MKNKFIKFLSLLLVILIFCSAFVVKGEENTLSEVQKLYNEILNYKLKESDVSDVQSLIDTEFSQNAGSYAEWYILALSQNGEKYDFGNYEKALLKYVDENTISSATTQQKYALSLISVGSTDGYIHKVLNNTVGKLGIMSYAYGLHLINNGYFIEGHTAESIVDKMLSLSCPDGGWSLKGDYCDVDVTAMVIQSLAPYYNQNTDIKNAIDNALNLLSEKQHENGGFLSYGTVNAESASQVIIALSAVGIDFSKDQRFIKNGYNILDALTAFRLPDGGFSHSAGGEYNENAIGQIFHALTSYMRFHENKGSVYILDNRNPSGLENTENNIPKTINYKFFICIGIMICAIAVLLVLLFTKRLTAKNLILILLVSGILIAGINFINISSAEEQYDTPKGEQSGTVTLTVKCDSIAGKAKHIPKDGIIIATEEIQFFEGETVFDVLKRSAKKHKILLESSSSGSLYIKGIANIYEFDFGELSGWVYTVNGEQISSACDEYTLSDKDVIEWHYTLELGEDIK